MRLREVFDRREKIWESEVQRAFLLIAVKCPERNEMKRECNVVEDLRSKSEEVCPSPAKFNLYY